MLNPVVDSDTGVHEACGVVGLWNVSEAAQVAALALHALQHRGQESAGIAASEGTWPGIGSSESVGLSTRGIAASRARA